MYYIGIDPGKEGAIVVNLDGKIIDTFVVPKIGKEVDLNMLNEYLKKYVGMEAIIGIENVHALFNSSAKSTFGFGHICGVLEMCIVANGISFQKVNPKIWQKLMWMGIPEHRKPSKKEGTKGAIDTKLMSLLAVKRLFPSTSLIDGSKPKARKDHDGIVDAILISEYMRRTA